MELSLPTEKLKKIRAESWKLLGEGLISCCALSRLIGKMNTANLVILPAPLFYRYLQMDLTEALGKADQEYETHLYLLSDSKEELAWWDTQMVRWNGKLYCRRSQIWSSTQTPRPRVGERLGSDMGGPWSVEAHQLPRASSSHIGCESVHKEQDEIVGSTQAGQYLTSTIREV